MHRWNLPPKVFVLCQSIIMFHCWTHYMYICVCVGLLISHVCTSLCFCLFISFLCAFVTLSLSLYKRRARERPPVTASHYPTCIVLRWLKCFSSFRPWWRNKCKSPTEQNALGNVSRGAQDLCRVGISTGRWFKKTWKKRNELAYQRPTSDTALLPAWTYSKWGAVGGAGSTVGGGEGKKRKSTGRSTSGVSTRPVSHARGGVRPHREGIRTDIEGAEVQRRELCFLPRARIKPTAHTTASTRVFRCERSEVKSRGVRGRVWAIKSILSIWERERRGQEWMKQRMEDKRCEGRSEKNEQDQELNENGHSVERIPSHITRLGIELWTCCH